MQPNILSTISAGARRRENMRLLALKNRLNAVKEEMLLSRDVQDQYNKIPYGDERDQLEFDFTCNRDFADECGCEKCSN